MTDSINVIVTIEIEGIEIDDELLYRRFAGELSQYALDAEILLAISRGNYMEISIKDSKIVGP